jgi:hypothetical protein
MDILSDVEKAGGFASNSLHVAIIDSFNLKHLIPSISQQSSTV